MPKKYVAFSLLELMIAMLLSSIISLTVFGCYQAIRNHQMVGEKQLLKEQQMAMGWEIIKESIHRSGVFGCYALGAWKKDQLFDHTALINFSMAHVGFVRVDYGDIILPPGFKALDGDVLAVVYGKESKVAHYLAASNKVKVVVSPLQALSMGRLTYGVLASCERMDVFKTNPARFEEGYQAMKQYQTISYSVRDFFPKFSKPQTNSLELMELGYDQFFTARRGDQSGLYLKPLNQDPVLIWPGIQQMSILMGRYDCDDSILTERPIRNMSTDQRDWDNIRYVRLILKQENGDIFDQRVAFPSRSC